MIKEAHYGEVRRVYLPGSRDRLLRAPVVPRCKHRGGAGMKYEEVEEAVMDELITKTEAVEKIAEWLEIHPEGKAWGMSAIETAELIMGDSEDE